MRFGHARGLVIAVFALLALAPSASAATSPLSSIGTPGTAAGQLLQPMDVAIAADGTMSVAENGNDRVSQFSADGTFIRAFGANVIPGGAVDFEKCTTATGCQAGAGSGVAGGLNAARGIAIDPASGDLYVTQPDYNRVSVLDSDGDFKFAFGWDVDPSGGPGTLETCTTATGCQPGLSGDGLGQMSIPTGIDVADGEVFVSNYTNNNIKVFTLAGAYLRTIGTGEVASPEGLTVVGDEFYVIEAGSNRISKFATAGGLIAAYGTNVAPGGGTGFESCGPATGGCDPATAGTGLGQFSGARGIAVNGSTVFVSDTGQARIQRITTAPAPAPVETFGWDVDSVASGTGFEVCSANCQAGVVGNGVGQLATPFDMELDCRGALWVAEYDNGRIARFGEPGTPLPTTCTTPPSNDFTFGKVTRNKRKGTAMLPVRVPGAGVVRLGGLGVRAAVRRPTAAGTVRLPIRPKGKVKLIPLNRNGRVFVRARVRFTPTGGSSRSKTKRIRLIKRRR